VCGYGGTVINDDDDMRAEYGFELGEVSDPAVTL